MSGGDAVNAVTSGNQLSTVAFCHADIDGFRIVFLLNFLLHI